MSTLRDEKLSATRSARTACLRVRKSRLLALNAITATITKKCGLSPSLDTDFDAIPSPPLTPSESRFLEENDIEKGRYFQDSCLPVTLEAIQAISSFQLPPSEFRENASEPSKESTREEVVAPASAAADAQISHQAIPIPEPIKDTQSNHVNVHPETARAGNGPIRPSDVAKKHPEHHPKTVHLPPREVQEERLRARRQSRDEQRAAQLREAEGHRPPELTSSPSSTAGARSAATPMPAEYSPVTSVGDDLPVSADRQEKDAPEQQIPNSDETLQLQKQHHDNQLEARKEAARREILGPDMASPDDQLRFEQEQAAKAVRDAAAAAAAPTTTSIITDSQLTPVLVPNADSRATESSDRDSQLTKQADAAPVAMNVAINTELHKSPQVKEPVHEATENSQPAIDNRESLTSHAAIGTLPGTPRKKSAPEVVSQAAKSPLATSKRRSIQDVSNDIVSPNRRTTDVQGVRHQRIPSDTDVHRSGQSKKQFPELPVRHEGYEALRGAAEDPAKDYLEPLFKMQIFENLPVNKTLSELLQRASKVVSTSDQFAGIHERQDHRILRRIYGLQNANKWSLRQMQPMPEPAGPKTHMDHLISEMKWMRTDFRQERKYKKAFAKLLAEECVTWVHSNATARLAMQVAVKAREDTKVASNALHSPADTNFENGEMQSQEARSPPGLESGNEQDESSSDDFDIPRTPQYAAVAPSMFPASMYPAMNIPKDDVTYIDLNTFATVIEDLPLYAPFEDEDPDPAPQLAQRTVPPVSKFCEGKIMTHIPSPIKKRSRFEYEDTDEDDAPPAKRLRAKDGAGISPEQTDVALFDPENKLLRDRLHSNTAFRPPSEFPMPSSQFYEFRISSQWIAEDDQHLRRLAKDYSFNWSLIADEMSLPSNLAGAADRRTPWECFERWVELESLPNEMRKTVYFKTWNSRIDAAQRNNDHRYQAQLQAQSQTPNQPQNIVRRRTQPIRVEKRRTNRYLHVVDAMRKNARKREQHAHKQAEAQKAASLRKQHESTAPKSAMNTPAEFSRLRHERDVQFAQRQEQYRQQVLARQREAALQQRGGQFAGQAGNANPGQARPANAQQLQPGQQPQQQGSSNGQMHPAQQSQAPRSTPHLAVPQMGMQGNIPQAQMQANMRGNNVAPTNHAAGDGMQGQRMALENARRQAQLNQQQQQQQAQMNGQQNQMNGQQFQMGPPNRMSPNGAPTSNGMINGQANPAMMAAMQQPNGTHNSTSNGTSTMQQNYSGHTNQAATSASPHMPPPSTATAQQQGSQQPQQLSSGHVPAITQITHSLQAKHPNATPEQIKELTSQHLKQFYSQQQTNHQARQSAMHAAAGTHGVTPTPANQSTYNQSQNQAAFQQSNVNMATNGHTNTNMPANSNNSGNGQPPVYPNAPATNGVSQSPNHYSAAMRQQMIQQRQNQIQSQAMASGSPRVNHASPNMAHASPNMAQAVPNMNGVPPVNRTPTPQMTRLGSSGGQPGPSALQSPGLQQGSPRAVPAGVAQRQ